MEQGLFKMRDTFCTLAAAWPHKHLLAITLGVTAFAIFVVSFFAIPNPAVICLVAVVFSAFLGGFLYGSLSGCLMVLYCGYFFAHPGTWLCYSGENLYKMLTIVSAVSATVLLVGTLKRQVEARTRELEAANEELHRLSTVDGLTGLANRRCFEQWLARQWRRSARDKAPLSVALVDVDFFKKYNDTYGHQAGDECLRQVTRAIAGRARRPGDFAARYGGEEFVILLADTPLAGALRVGEEIRQLVENLRLPHRASAIGACVTVSVGVASLLPHEGGSQADFIKQADVALYHAKRCGRNKVQPYREGVEAYCGFRQDDAQASANKGGEFMSEYAIRCARREDLATVEALLAASGLPTAGVAPQVEQFLVAQGEELLGVLGVHAAGTQALLRSFAVRPERRNSGIGQALVEGMLARLRRQHCREAYLLTETAAAYFQRHGFTDIRREAMPQTLLAASGLADACPCSSRCLKLLL